MHAKLEDAKNPYGAKHGETEFVGWQMQAPNLAGFTQTPRTIRRRGV